MSKDYDRPSEREKQEEFRQRTLRTANRLAMNQIHPGNRLRLLAGLPLLPVKPR